MFPINAAKRIPIDRIDDVDSDLAAQYVKARKPFVSRVKDWGALAWDVEYFRGKLGHQTRVMKRVATNELFDMTVSDLLDLIQDPGWKSRIHPTDGGGPIFVLRRWNEFNEDTAALHADIKPPHWLPAHYTCVLSYRNSARGPIDAFHHTPCHWEDNAFASLNLQVKGKKHLFLFSPDDARLMGFESALLIPPHLSLASDAFMHPEKYPGVSELPCYETILEPGDVVHWPAFWSHWFVHHPVEQINLGFWWEPPTLALNPLSAAWALSNALAAAVGGFGELPDALERMSPETRELLVKMEQHLINSPQLLRPSRVTMARMQAGSVLPLDESDYATPPAKE